MKSNINSKKRNIFDYSKPILCSIEGYEPIPIEKMLNVVDKENKIIDTRLADCNNISRNRCFYGLNDVLNSLRNSKYVQECIAQGIWFGELEHPPRGCDMERFMKIEDSNVSHVIKKYYTEGNFLKGIVQFIPPKGDLVWDWITKANVNIAFSLRIYTPNYVKQKDEKGVEYIKKLSPMYPVTFDVVKTPGYERVRVVDPSLFASKNSYFLTSGMSGTESFEYTIDWFPGDSEKLIKRIVEEGSEELDKLSDLLNLDLKKSKAIFNKDKLQVTFSTEDCKNAVLNVNTYILNEVMRERKK